MNDLEKLYEVASDEEALLLRDLQVRAGLLLSCSQCGATYPELAECEFCGIRVGGPNSQS